VSCEIKVDSAVPVRLKTAVADLRILQGLLLSDDLDPRLLSEFRDVLNRIRNVAWAAQQSIVAQLSGEGSAGIDSLLAAERIRAAYQLCRLIQEDLGKSGIDFQKGQLAELQSVTAGLNKQLSERL
jgi:hypothetical protein